MYKPIHPFEIMEARHSVRQYKDQAIEPEKRTELERLLESLNRQYGLHMQIIYDDPACFQSIMAHYGKFEGVSNYIALVGPKSPLLEETLGYCGEQLVLKAQELGLNTCWVALTYGKSAASVLENEKEICVISLGYGKTQGVPHKDKPIEKLCNYSENLPDWFLQGMRAAMLAPTATNQQKFRLELLADGSLKISRGLGFYSKMDLGIIKYHFELGSGKKIF